MQVCTDPGWWARCSPALPITANALGAVLLSALAIKTLTFFSEQDPLSLLQRWRGGNNGND
ncbi:Hypothetical protein ABZS17H1_02674 [Kosakonia cowanii]